MPDRKSLLEMAVECERRAREVESGGDSAQLRLLAKQLREMQAKALASTPAG